MKSKLVSDWWQVFRFTFKQGTIGKGFKLTTVIIALIMLGVGIVINIAMAISQKDDMTKSTIENVYLINNSGMDKIYYDNLISSNEDKYGELKFIESNEEISAVNQTVMNKGEEVADVILEIAKEQDSFIAKVLLPTNTTVDRDEAESFGEDFILAVEISKMLSMDIPIENQMMALSDVVITQANAGDIQESEDEEMLRYFIPFIFVMFLYFINLTYGQTMGNVVSIEKSSKLVEFMMTFTSPYSFLFGKIVATASIAIGQLALWIGAFVGGFVVGDRIASAFVYTKYENDIYMIMDLLKGQEGSSSFSIGAIILGIVTVCLSILFYCMLAAFVSSFVSKAEELSNVMSVYQIVMVIGFLCSYIMPMEGGESLTTVARIIPFTSAYTLPGDILVGNVSLPMGMLYMSILLLSVTIVVYATGKVYMSRLFNRGKSGKIQLIFEKLFGTKG